MNSRFPFRRVWFAAALVLVLGLSACAARNARYGENSPYGTPAGALAGTPAGASAGTPAGVPAGTPAGTPVGTPAGTPAGAAAGTPGGTPGSTVNQDASHPVGGQSSGPQTLTVRDVNKDKLPSNQQLADMIKLGHAIFTQTPQNAPQYVGNSLSCSSCHINGGQKEGALPLVGIAAQFPAFSPRDNRLISLEDRIRSCFARSEAGTAPPYDSKELLAVSSYLTWLSTGQPEGVSPPWRGKNAIPKDKQIPIADLNVDRGQALYGEKCAVCHGADGQGQSGPPLWGPKSFNDGAGTARVYTLAGFIRYAMPLTAPGSLNDEEAQHLAAFINSHDRPAFNGKDKDYLNGTVPVDAVYYPQRYKENPLKKPASAPAGPGMDRGSILLFGVAPLFLFPVALVVRRRREW